MGKLRVTVVDGDAGHCQKICASLEQAKIGATPFYALEGLPEHLRKKQARVMIIDLDSLPVDNNFFRTIKKHNPDLHILCLSSRTHHPGLQEAMGSHIYASLGKPLNAEELFYWLKTVA
jgi:DNA-binding NtrC family response regulator